MGNHGAQFTSKLEFSCFQAILALQTHPESSGVPEIAGEQQRGLSRNGSFTVVESMNLSGAHADGLGQSILRDIHWPEKLPVEYLPPDGLK